MKSSLTPISYRIDQDTNEYFYYIEIYDRSGPNNSPRWVIRFGPPYDPQYLIAKGQFRVVPDKFFHSEIEALGQWRAWYETNKD